MTYRTATKQIVAALPGTQQQIADAVGLSQSHVHRIRSGQRMPSPEVLERLAKIAGGELVIEFRIQKAKGKQ